MEGITPRGNAIKRKAAFEREREREREREKERESTSTTDPP
jgi:hypothetical protein